MARTYKRDSRGRFASGGGSSGSGGRPKARMQQRGTNRLTRDNAGRIQGIGGSGATARGGRLKTASGKQRGAVLMKAQGQGRLRGGKGAGGAAAAAKVAKVAARSVAKAAQKARGVDPAKVERILKRVTTEPARTAKLDRKWMTKSRNATDTRLRAMSFLAKAAGAKNVKVVKGTRKVSGDYGDMTREQLLANVARKLSKPTMRSTAKSNSRIAADRTKARKENAAQFGRTARGEGAAYLYGRRPSGARQTLRVMPDSPTSAKGQRPIYSFDKVTRSRTGSMGSRLASDGKTFLNSKTVIFSGRKSLRSRGNAARAQAGRRAAVGRLAGTARLGNATSAIKRGKARQATLTGGTRTTFGRPRFVRR